MNYPSRLRYASLAMAMIVVWIIMFGLYQSSADAMRLAASRIGATLLSYNETLRREKMKCQTIVAQSLFIVDSDGYLCERFSVSDVTGCCLPNRTRLAMPCTGCKPFADQAGKLCCQVYEYCIACCMRTKIGLQACVADCRTNSSSPNVHQQYAHPKHRFCARVAPGERRRPHRAGVRPKPDERDDGGGGTAKPIIY